MFLSSEKFALTIQSKPVNLVMTDFVCCFFVRQCTRIYICNGSVHSHFAQIGLLACEMHVDALNYPQTCHTFTNVCIFILF